MMRIYLKSNKLFNFASIYLFCFFIDLTNSDLPCPFNECEFCEIIGNFSIYIRGCKDNNNQKFDKNLNIILSSNPGTKILSIVRVTLQDLIPICHQINLNSLELVENNLHFIPSDCFDDFRSIRYIQITSNKIKSLRKGTFAGLDSLEGLNLENNTIEHIDDAVFSNTSDLVKLKNINLMSNNLTTVGAWVFMKPLQSTLSYFHVDLRSNCISQFHNPKNWKFVCKDKKIKYIDFNFDFTNNKIKHISDFINAYFMTKYDFVCLLAYKNYKVSLRMKSNPIICDCIDYGIATFIWKAKSSTGFDEISCYGPLELQGKKFAILSPHEFVCESRDNCVQGCKCIEQPSTSIFHIDCNALNTLETLPNLVPQTKLHKYNLTFSRTHISRFESRMYFNKTSYLDISNSDIFSISNEFFISIKDIEFVYLHDNLLSSLPKEACMKETFSFKELTLYNNPWNCNCDNLWMKAWLNKSISVLRSPLSIYCGEPYWNKNKNIFALKDEDFCKNPFTEERNRTLLTILTPVFVSILFVCIVGVLIWKLKVRIHTKFGIHPFDRDECEGENMIYDVFISASFQDRLFAISLVKTLKENGYRVCYHEQDFTIGISIHENICQAVRHSKRSIFVFSNDFFEAPYCLFEFQTALHRNIEISKNRLIALLLDLVVISEESTPAEIYEYLMTHTYVKVRNGWMDQLLYSLTVNKIQNSSTNLDFN